MVKKIVLINIIMLAFYSNLFSQFGKNKVQYDDFVWKYIETKHFDIYFSNGAKHLAEFTAFASEEALSSISETLNYRINKRINIIIYNSHNEFQQTNVTFSYLPEGVGGFTELFKNRVVLPFQGNYEQFKHVIHHELVHAVINDLFFGGTFQTSVSTGKSYDLPLWMNEGLAEWESIGGLNTETDMFMRDIALNENEYLGLEYLNGYFAYRGGQSFYDYVATKYGIEKVRELINKSRIYGNTNLAFKQCFNLSIEEFSEKWKEDLKKFYWPDISIFESPNDFSQRITNHKKDYINYYTSPAISPNGEEIAFISDKDGVFGIYIIDIKTKKIRNLVSSFRAQDFEQLNLLTPGISWNPDGSKIAISAKAGPEDAIFIVDAKSGKYQKLTFNFKSISSVAWSPDGNYIAFSALKNGQSDLYVYSFFLNNIESITNDVFSDFIPVWSSDSKKIYFISDRGDFTDKNDNNTFKKIWKHNVKQSDIYSVNIKDKEITRITFEPQYKKISLALSPDNQNLLFVSDKNGINNIYNLNLQNNSYKPITNSLNAINQISITPNGSKLVFSSLINSGFDLFLINNPFAITLKNDTLPLTKLRERENEKNKLESNILNLKNEPQQKLVGYGDYELDFNRQQTFKPNPDIKRKPTDFGYNQNLDSNFIEKDYKIKFTMDLAQGNPGVSTYYGFQGIAQMLFSDVLGNHQIFAQANLILDLKNSNIGITYLYLENKVDWQFSIFHNSYIVNILDELNIYSYNRMRNWGASSMAQLPFNTFNRIEGGISWLNLSKENLEYNVPMVSKMLFVPEIGFVHDDVLWGLYAPSKGLRYNINLKGTPKLSETGISFGTIRTDIRQYIPLFDNYLNIALRGAAGVSIGTNPQKFFLGGTEGWINTRFSNNALPFNQPEDFAFMNFEMPLRGFPVNEINGSKFFLTNLELRFPLFRALVAGPVPILLQGVMGSFFMDLGGAWSGDFKDFKATKVDEFGKLVSNNLIMSAGIGVRTYLFGLPVKLDIAWRNEYYNWSQPDYMFSLGYDF